MFEKLQEGVYRLCVPFENIFTSVFAIVYNQHTIVIDSASTKNDVENYIIPALKDMNLIPDWIICSHFHSDHCGGMPEMISYFPNAMIGFADCAHPNFEINEKCHAFADGEVFGEKFKALNLKGHTEDALGILDMRTNTLLSNDCLQLYGVGRYGTGVENSEKYLQSIERLKNMPLECIIASHEYAPLGFKANGKDKTAEYLNKCESIINDIKTFVCGCKAADCGEIANAYNLQNSSLPPIVAHTVKGILKLCGDCLSSKNAE